MANATTAEFSFDTIKPEEGDVIIVHLPQAPTEESILRLSGTLRAVFPKNHAMLLPFGMDLVTANEDAMREAGWVPIT